MKPITETMRWAIEQAIRGRTKRYGTAARTAVVDASIHQLEKTDGHLGMSSESLVAALRIICREFDHLNRKILHGCTDHNCDLCDKERLR